MNFDVMEIHLFQSSGKLTHTVSEFIASLSETLFPLASPNGSVCYRSSVKILPLFSPRNLESKKRMILRALFPSSRGEEASDQSTILRSRQICVITSRTIPRRRGDFDAGARVGRLQRVAGAWDMSPRSHCCRALRMQKRVRAVHAMVTVGYYVHRLVIISRGQQQSAAHRIISPFAYSTRSHNATH